MSLSAKVKAHSNVAVFARNWPAYLEEAVKIAENSPEQPVTFRAQTVWRAAETAVNVHGPRKIYFAPNEGEGLVEYLAVLEKVVLYPEANAQVTKELLDKSLKSTSQEGLWSGGVRTLYVISHCVRLQKQERFPYTELRKLSDDLPISEGYTRAYVIVYEH